METRSQSQEYFFLKRMELRLISVADSARAALALCSGAFLTPIAPAASLSCRNSQSCLLLESIKNWLARALLYFVRKSSQHAGVNVRNISKDAGFPRKNQIANSLSR
jgi:hypothetical protein